MANNNVASRRTHRQEEASSVSGQSVGHVLRRQGYKLGKVIGSGSYSKVHVAHKVHDNGEHTQMACKVISRKTASPEFVAKFLPREIDTVRQISHPNLVKIYDVFDFKDDVYMFMEYFKKGDLLQFIQNGGAIAEPLARSYFRQMVSAIKYMHSLELTHRDLKCENILMSFDGNTVKLTDFGFSRRIRDDSGRVVLSETFCGSKSYAAPEVLQNRPYNPKMSDAWSLGCILHVMLTACLPFPESNVKRLLSRQQGRLIGFGGKNGQPISDDVKRLVRKILEPHISARATVDQMLQDGWTVGVVDTSQEVPLATSSAPV